MWGEDACALTFLALSVPWRNAAKRETDRFMRYVRQIAGPMWAAPIHNRDFVKEMLEHVESNPSDFKTSDRIKGMLRVALAVRRAPSISAEG